MRDRVLRIAKRWVGTPYQHQASCEGVGADCLGLIRGIWRELYGAEHIAIPAYTQEWSEPSREEMLLQGLRGHLPEIESKAMSCGDILVFRMKDGSVAKHLAILAAVEPIEKIIHSYSGRGVVETHLSSSWKRRIAGVFRFPDRSI